MSHPYRLPADTVRSEILSDVEVEGLGFPKDGTATVNFDSQGVPWCTKTRCAHYKVGKVDMCMLRMGVQDESLCYPVIAMSMAPLKLRLLRAWERGGVDGLDDFRDETGCECE